MSMKSLGVMAGALASIGLQLSPPHPAAARTPGPARIRRNFIWLHPTKGWKGAVYHPKRGRARPIRQAQIGLDGGMKVRVIA